MRIAIDIREATVDHPTGKGMWTKKVLEELRKREDVELIEFSKKYVIPSSMKAEHFGGAQHRLREDRNAYRGAYFSTISEILWHLKTARAVRKMNVDLYLAPTSYIVPFLLGRKVKTAIVIHDLIALDHEPHDRKAILIERLTLPRVLKTAHCIFTVSNATKEDLLKKFPKTDSSKVTVIYAGPTINNQQTTCLPKLQEERRSNKPINQQQKYILSIGTLCPRKNQLRLIQAFNKLPSNLRTSHKLILAGGHGWQDGTIIKLAKESENVEWLGYVLDEKLTELLQNATLLAYPSLKEGFGFPVLDAMVMGIPVLTSRGTSMEEITGNAAVLVDPESIESIQIALEKILRNVDIRESCTKMGEARFRAFRWEYITNGIKSRIG